MSAQTYNAAVDMVDRNVAEGRGAKIAFSDPARRITYGELADGVARVGAMLAKLGFFAPGVIVAYAAAVVTGIVVGLVAGKPIWAEDARIEAGTKAIAGAILGVQQMGDPPYAKDAEDEPVDFHYTHAQRLRLGRTGIHGQGIGLRHPIQVAIAVADVRLGANGERKGACAGEAIGHWVARHNLTHGQRQDAGV